jgi:hypothetical protein
VLYTGREGSDYYNRVGGVDGFVRLSDPLSARFQLLHSSTRYPIEIVGEYGQPSGNFTGQAFRAQLNYNTRDWRVSSFYQSFDPDFRSDAGFVTRVDMRQFDLRGTKHFWADQANWFTRFGITSGFGRREDFSGQVLDQFQGQTFTIDRLNISAGIQPIGDLSLDFFGQFGEVVDFANVREARLFMVNPEMNLRLGRHINFAADHRL